MEITLNHDNNRFVTGQLLDLAFERFKPCKLANDATPSLAQAIKMKKFMQDGKLTDEVFLTRQNGRALEIAFHHDNNRFVTGQILNLTFERFKPCKLTSLFPPVTDRHGEKCLRTENQGV